ncbi:hypothetical protein C0Q70_08000 [Pomacea canaliculata]|uniref:Uncharacterized protein n=1 Tax=Pomacea canaliculata TaxID=400727 RepID=A0A2T7PGK9_POMCA|nr:hypothetical protein C0Q70_08000 [Pomacea canaliculata]
MVGAAVGIALQENTAPTRPKLPRVPRRPCYLGSRKEGVWMEAAWNTWGAWWLATQAMMCFGLGLALFALLVATVALCCECKRCNSNHAVAGLLLLAFLVIGVAVVVFGISAKDELSVDLESQQRYSWSFWLAAASSGLSLISAIIYVCEGRAQY